MHRGPLAALLGAAIIVGLSPGSGLFASTARAGDVGWGTPMLVASDDDAYGPRVAVDGKGKAIVAWQQHDGARTNIRAARFVPGIGWAPPTFIETSLDDAGWPQVAVDAAGNAIVAWMQTRWGQQSEVVDSTVWTNRYRVDAGWGAPVPIDSGTGYQSFLAWSGTSLGLSSVGEGVLAWLEAGERSSSFPVSQIWAVRFSPRTGWGVPQPGPTGYAVNDVVVDELGNAMITWCGPGTGHGCQGRLAGRFVSGAGWLELAEIDDTRDAHGDTRIALARSGEAFIVYPDLNEVESGIWARRHIAGSGWDAAVRISEAGTGIRNGTWAVVPDEPDKLAVTWIGNPAVVSDGSDNLIVVWNQQNWTPNGEVIDTSVWTNRFVAGIGWNTPTPVREVQSTFWRVAADPHGNAFLAWIEPGDRTRVLASRFVPDTGWGEAVPLGPEVPSLTENDIYAFSLDVATDRNGNAIAVWSQPDGIWANRFVLDPTLDTDSFLIDLGIVLAETRDALGAMRANLAVLEAKFAILLVIQSAFIGSTVLLLVLYMNLRRRIPGRGKAPIEGTGPPNPPPKPASGRLDKQTLGTVADPSHRRRAGPSIRWSDASGSLRLTAKERILLHLLDFARYTEASDVPEDLTLGGIAEEAGVDLRHFAQYIRPLVRDGLVRQRMARVKGGLQRRKVYVLADGGRQSALAIRERVRSAVVRVRDDGVLRDATVAEVISAARGSLSILDAVRASISEGLVDLEANDKGTGR